MSKPYRDKIWLKTKYWDEGLTQKQIADLCNVSPRTIRKYMNRHDIPRRDIVGEHHPLHGKSRSEETKQKISDTMQGREFSEETRARISEALSGKTIPPDAREKISESLTEYHKARKDKEP